MKKFALKSTIHGKTALLERKNSQYIPYLRHVTPEVIKTKDGEFVIVLKIEGFFYQTADITTILQLMGVRNTAFMSLKSSKYSIYSHVIRREVSAELPGDFDTNFCHNLHETYTKRLDSSNLFQNDLYLTIVLGRFQGKVGIADDLLNLVKSVANNTGSDEKDLEAAAELLDIARNIKSTLEKHSVTILKAVQRANGLFTEPAEFLVQLINGAVPRPVRLPQTSIANWIAEDQILAADNIEFRGVSEKMRRFGAILSLDEYPKSAMPGVLDELLTFPHEFIITQSFRLADRTIALERMNRLEKQIKNSDEADTEVHEQLFHAIDNLASNRSIYGDHHMSILCLASSLKALDTCVSDVHGHMLNQGFFMKRDTLTLQATFWAQLPGNRSYISRQGMISSINFAGLASNHNYPTGRKIGNHWGSAITVFETSSQAPYFFNFHVRDVGHFTVTGPTGTGKTVLLNFLMSETQRLKTADGQRPRVAFFDKDRGAEVAVRAMGGRYERLEDGEATGFNPTQLDDTPENRAFLKQLLAYMVCPADKSDLTATELDIIADAVNDVMRLDKADRRLSTFEVLFEGHQKRSQNDIVARFRRWLDPKQNGWLFNNESDTLDLKRNITGFDMTSILDHPELRTAALLYIFHRISIELDYTPFLIFLDEGWKLLDDEVFISYIKEALKVFRKKNALVGLGTQSPEDIAQSRIHATLLQQTSTNIFFPNPRATEEGMKDPFKLSDREFEWVLNTPPERREFLIRQGDASVIARFKLRDMDPFIKVLSGTSASVAECEDLRRQYGEDPDAWLPSFMGR